MVVYIAFCWFWSKVIGNVRLDQITATKRSSEISSSSWHLTRSFDSFMTTRHKIQPIPLVLSTSENHIFNCISVGLLKKPWNSCLMQIKGLFWKENSVFLFPQSCCKGHLFNFILGELQGELHWVIMETIRVITLDLEWLSSPIIHGCPIWSDVNANYRDRFHWKAIISWQDMDISRI